MKKQFLGKAITLIAASSMLVSLSSQAGLIDRGNGMIYDDVLDVTWLQDADYAKTSGFDADGLINWNTASSWASSVVYGGFDDWRLPSIVPIDGSEYDFDFSFDGTTDRGFNGNTNFNEMLYMYAVNLENISYFDTSGAGMQPGSASFNNSFTDAETGELVSFGLDTISFWTSVANDPIFNAAWAVNFRTTTNISTGESQLLNLNAELGAWLLRDGDVVAIVDPVDPVPQVSSPGTLGLFSVVLCGLAFGRQRLSNMTKKGLEKGVEKGKNILKNS
jgi:hypothetical protein